MEDFRIACRAVRIAVPVEDPAGGVLRQGGALTIAEAPDPRYCSLTVTAPNGDQGTHASVTVLLDYKTWKALEDKVFSRYSSSDITKPEESTDEQTPIEQLAALLNVGDAAEVIDQVKSLRSSLNYSFEERQKLGARVKELEGQIASVPTVNTAPQRRYDINEPSREDIPL